jgi:hypothetical protein
VRFAHWLKPIHTSETIQQAIFFDTETHQEKVDDKTVKHVLDFGWACYVRRLHNGAWSNPKWVRFTHIIEFWLFVFDHTRPKTKLYMFCHNTGFDLPVLNTFDALTKHGWKLETAIIENPPTILKFTKDRCTIKILDTLNIWRVKLEKIGKFVGLPKLDYDSAKLSPDEFDTYCKRDVEILVKAVTEWTDFLKLNDFGGFADTLASQSKKIFQHKFMRHKIGIHDDMRVCKLERDSLHGGRTECFRLGAMHGTWHLLDFNSQYPYVMQINDYPTKLAFTFKEITLDRLRDVLERYCVTARVILRTENAVYPSFLHERLVFPVGNFQTVLSTPELKYALKNGHCVQILEGAGYEKAMIFEGFISELYKRRMQARSEGNFLYDELFKICMNSLFGKFAQHGNIYEKIDYNPNMPNGNWVEIDHITKKQTNYRALCGLVQELKHTGESRDSFPAIAAHVTAHGRILLWEYMQEAGQGNYCYCDTDGFWVNDVGLQRLKMHVDPDVLGKLKLERSVNDFVIHGLKDYQYQDVVKIKGIRKDALWIADNIAVQESWSSLKGALRDGHLDAPWTRTIEKELSRDYSKGIVNSDGMISPFKLELSPPMQLTG